MSEATHTPTPWMVSRNSDEGLVWIDAPEGYAPSGVADLYHRHGRELGAFCAKHNAEANAEFIVRACNAHDDLVECLRSIVNFCEKADDPEHHTLGLVKHLARDALAKAEAKT